MGVVDEKGITDCGIICIFSEKLHFESVVAFAYDDSMQHEVQNK